MDLSDLEMCEQFLPLSVDDDEKMLVSSSLCKSMDDYEESNVIKLEFMELDFPPSIQTESDVVKKDIKLDSLSDELIKDIVLPPWPIDEETDVLIVYCCQSTQDCEKENTVIDLTLPEPEPEPFEKFNDFVVSPWKWESDIEKIKQDLKAYEETTMDLTFSEPELFEKFNDFVLPPWEMESGIEKIELDFKADEAKQLAKETQHLFSLEGFSIFEEKEERGKEQE